MIRDAKVEDAERLLEIYSYYVKNTAITFEITVPTIEEFKNRIIEYREKYPYIVLEEENKICGYAYAHAFGEREAYKYSVKVSIYLDNDLKGKGYGRKLYEELINRLKNMGVKNVYALVVYNNENNEYINNTSYLFHKSLGFAEVGKLNKCGNKFGNLYDVVYFEKLL